MAQGPVSNCIIQSSQRLARYKLAFLQALGADLRALGIKASARSTGTRVTFRADLRSFDPQAALLLIKERRRLEQALLVNRAASTSDRHIDRFQVDVDRIKPTITFCTTKADRAEFAKLATLHSVPPPRLLFRRFSGIVRDAGNDGFPVMGIFALSSSVFSLAARDRHFGWGSHNMEEIKLRGLNCSMQLSLCMSVPPYNALRASRLIAGLAVSSEVAEHFKSRYAKRQPDVALHAVITTSVGGAHSAIFNRIMLREGGLYKRVGLTSGYSSSIFSQETVAAGKQIVSRVYPEVDTTRARTIQLLKYSFEACGIPRDELLRLGIQKGVYIAHGGLHSLEFLQGAADTAIPAWPSSTDVVAYWKSRDLPKALASRPGVTMKG